MHVAIIPCYGYQNSLDSLLAVLQEYPQLHLLIIDDGSQPNIRANGVEIIRHPINKGYGAAQKTGYRRALELKAQTVFLIHGDGQYSAPHMIKASQTIDADILLGSRMIHPKRKDMPYWRRAGNRFLTQLANRHFRVHYTDLHTGARIFQRSFLQTVPFEQFSDDFVFDQQLLVWAIQKGASIQEFPIPPLYSETISSIDPIPSIRYGLGCLWTIYSSSLRSIDPNTPRSR
ncbi:MAG: glycosyltransferase family 2 protein [Myxococcota bacterium]|nr:glycosyltransferase family 2 protein [Myxococcota bacterium]